MEKLHRSIKSLIDTVTKSINILIGKGAKLDTNITNRINSQLQSRVDESGLTKEVLKGMMNNNIPAQQIAVPQPQQVTKTSNSTNYGVGQVFNNFGKLLQSNGVNNLNATMDKNGNIKVTGNYNNNLNSTIGNFLNGFRH